MIRKAVWHLFLACLSVSREALFVKSGAADFTVAGFVTKLEVSLAEVHTFLVGSLDLLLQPWVLF